MKKLADIITTNAARIPALGFWVTVFCIVPLYFENAYFNISQAKAHAFNSCSVLLIIVFSLLYICLRFAGKKGKPALDDSGGAIKAQKGDHSVLFFSAFGLISLLSCVCSGDPRLSFWGYEGWGIGAFAILCFNMFITVMRRELPLSKIIWLPAMLSASAVYAIGILHISGIDVFGMHQRIVINEIYSYISTIGNKNWFNGYLCIMIPLFTLFFISCKKRGYGIALAVFLFITFINCAAATSDSVYVGIGTSVFFAAPYIAARRERLRGVCMCLVLYGAALAAVRIIPCFKDFREHTDRIPRIMLLPPVFTAVILSGLAGYAALRFYKDDRALKIKAACGICALPAAAAVYFIIDTVRSFSDSWGSWRGYIWRGSIEIFRGYTPLQKFIGAGPGMLKRYYSAYSTDSVLLSAHNEPLQILLTTGIFGLLVWMCAWGSLFYSYFRTKGWKNESAVYFAPIAACIGMYMTNSSNICGFGMLCAVTACYLISQDRNCSDKR